MVWQFNALPGDPFKGATCQTGLEPATIPLGGAALSKIELLTLLFPRSCIFLQKSRYYSNADCLYLRTRTCYADIFATALRFPNWENGSGRDRTDDVPVKSRILYQLSYGPA